MKRNEQITVPGAPALPGLTFRRFAGESDYPLLTEVFARYLEGSGIDAYVSAEDIARLYSNMKNFDPYHDFLMLEVNGELVAYGRAGWDEQEGEDGEGKIRIYWYRRYIVPEWWDRGLERALVLYNEKHLGEIAGAHDFAGPAYFEAYAYDRHAAAAAALVGEGYEPVRYEYEMLRPDLNDLPDVPLPDRLEVRSVEQQHLRAIWEAEVEAFRDHWGVAEPEEEDYGRWLGQPNFQPHLWQVAWEGDQVAGMVRNFISDEENRRYGRLRGYTEHISVRRPWRRRGLARALIARSFQMHKDMGITEAALSVDAQNPLGALQLYESMGFELVTRGVTYRKPIANV